MWHTESGQTNKTRESYYIQAKEALPDPNEDLAEFDDLMADVTSYMDTAIKKADEVAEQYIEITQKSV